MTIKFAKIILCLFLFFLPMGEKAFGFGFMSPTGSLTANQGFDGHAHKIYGEIVIEAPIQKVWSIITDYQKFSLFVPCIEKSTVLSELGNKSIVDFKLDVSMLTMPFKYRLQILADSDNKIISMYMLSGDFKSMQGSYKLKPCDNNTYTKLEYSLSMSFYNSLSQFLGASLLKKTTFDTLYAIQRKSQDS